MERRQLRGKRLIREARVYVEELQNRILQRFPDATFRTYHRYEPVEGIYIDVYVDTDNGFEVLDLVNDRAVDILIETGIPIYVIPLQGLPPREPAATPANGQS